MTHLSSLGVLGQSIEVTRLGSDQALELLSDRLGLQSSSNGMRDVTTYIEAGNDKLMYRYRQTCATVEQPSTCLSRSGHIIARNQNKLHKVFEPLQDFVVPTDGRDAPPA